MTRLLETLRSLDYILILRIAIDVAVVGYLLYRLIPVAKGWLARRHAARQSSEQAT